MAGGVLYLDIDDEITSAASRIREAEGSRVAIVVPYGSRVATSRINFRLLARDATTHQKRLSIVATDPATRALAASAGLPVFGTVGEYETSLEDSASAGGAASASESGASAASGSSAAILPAGTAAAPEAPTTDPATPHEATESSGETARVTTSSTRPRGGARARPATPPGQATLDEMEAEELRLAAASLAAGAVAGSGAAVSKGAAPARPTTTPTPDIHSYGPPRRPGPEPTIRSGPRSERVASRSGPSRTPLLIGLAVFALVVLVGGVGAYLLLPSAKAVITPRREAVGPIDITIVADPTVTEPDPVKGIVPAVTVSADVVASQTFAATGKRIDQQPATGVVRFRNKDFTSSNTIPKGSVVSTAAGIRFKTDQAVTVGRANIVGLQIFPRTATVSVTAVKPGLEGNVPANSIVVIPKDEDPISLDVTNPDDMTGGTHDEFPRILQGDVDAAMATLQAALEAAFRAKLADPATAPPGATVFAETATLGTATPSVDPTTLPAQEVATFDLGLTATGTAIAVDEAPVRSVAEQQLKAHVDSSHRLIDGSVEVTVKPAVVTDGRVTFPASVRATQIALLDPAAIKDQVRGRSIDEARSILETYGTVQLTVWPDWVSSVPTIDGRFDLSIDEAVSVESPTSPPSTSP